MVQLVWVGIKDDTWQNLPQSCSTLMAARPCHMSLYGWTLNLYESFHMWGALHFSFGSFGQGLGYARRAKKWGLEAFDLHVCQVAQEAATHLMRAR